MDLKEVFGEELANKIKEKLKDGLFFGHEKNFVNKERFNEINEQNKSYKSMLEETNKKLEVLKDNSTNSEELKKQLEELKKQNEEISSNYEKQLKETKFNNLLELALKDNKAKNNTAVKALLNLENVKMTEDGKLEGIKEELERIKEKDSYLFGEDKIIGTPPNPQNEPSKTEITKSLIDEMDRAGNTKFFIENEKEVQKILSEDI